MMETVAASSVSRMTGMTETCSSLRDDIEALVTAAVFKERARIVKRLRERSNEIVWHGMAMPPKYHSLDVAKYELNALADEIESKI